MVRTQRFHHYSPRSIPGLGTEIPHQAAAHQGKKKKKKKEKKKKRKKMLKNLRMWKPPVSVNVDLFRNRVIKDDQVRMRSVG